MLFTYFVCKMYFLRTSKKSDLRDQWHSGEQQQKKKVTKGNLENNPEAESVFTNSMDSSECL